MPKLDSRVKALLSMAGDQGWKISEQSGRYGLRPPDPAAPMVFLNSRAPGRQYANVLSTLQKAGLDVSSVRPDRAKPAPAKESDGFTYQECVDLVESKISKAEDFLNSDDPASAKLARLLTTHQNNLHLLVSVFAADISDYVSSLSETTDSKTVEVLVAHESCPAHIEKLKAQISKLGTELVETKNEWAASVERANKAENKLRVFRDALKED